MPVSLETIAIGLDSVCLSWNSCMWLRQCVCHLKLLQLAQAICVSLEIVAIGWVYVRFIWNMKDPSVQCAACSLDFFSQLAAVETRTTNVQNNVTLYQKLLPLSLVMWVARYSEFCPLLNCESVTLERRPVQWRTGSQNLKAPQNRTLSSLSFDPWCSYFSDKRSFKNQD